jgi:hypothetical protein
MKSRETSNRLESRSEFSQTTRTQGEKNTFGVLSRECAETRRAAVLKRDEKRLIEKLQEKSQAAAFTFAEYRDSVLDSACDFSGACVGSEKAGVISGLWFE